MAQQWLPDLKVTNHMNREAIQQMTGTACQHIGTVSKCTSIEHHRPVTVTAHHAFMAQQWLPDLKVTNHMNREAIQQMTGTVCKDMGTVCKDVSAVIKYTSTASSR